MADRIVVLRRDDPYSFVADACAALAAALNEPHAVSSTHDALVAAYAAMVRSYAVLLQPMIEGEARVRIIEHLLERLNQAERGERPIPIADVVDRLHAELVGASALV